MRKWITLAVLGLAAAMTVGALNLQAADTIKIGVVAPLTGPSAETGRYQIQGAKLAVEEINKAGGVLGKQVELIIEDDQTTNPGIIMAFSKLAGNKDIVGFLGSIRSTQMNAMSPDVLKLGKPVMIGGTDPTLTHMGNPWYFRTRPNDAYSARVIAEYGVNTLGKKKWAIVYSTDAFGTGGMKALVESLKGYGHHAGLDPRLYQQFVGLHARSAGRKAIRSRNLASYIPFETDLGIIAKQLRQLGVTIPWVGSATNIVHHRPSAGRPGAQRHLRGSGLYPDSCPGAKAYAQSMNGI